MTETNQCLQEPETDKKESILEFTIKREITIKVMVKEYSGTIQDDLSKESVDFVAIACFPKIGLLMDDNLVHQLNLQDEVFKKVNAHLGINV